MVMGTVFISEALSTKIIDVPCYDNDHNVIKGLECEERTVKNIMSAGIIIICVILSIIFLTLSVVYILDAIITNKKE